MKRKQKKEINTLKVMLRDREVILNSLGFTPEQIMKDPFVIKMKVALKGCFNQPKKKLYHPNWTKWQWVFFVYGILILLAMVAFIVYVNVWL